MRLTYSIGTKKAAAAAAAADDGDDDDDGANAIVGALKPPRADDWVGLVFPASVVMAVVVVVAGSTVVHVGGRGALRISDTTCLNKKKRGVFQQEGLRLKMFSSVEQ